ncbi:MAG: hypothetical protein WBL45_08070 [Solirubrobacterales bacterium]
MGLMKRILGALIVAGLAAMIGCGGGSSSNSDSTSPTSTSDSGATTAPQNTESPNSASEPSKEFLSNGKNGQLARIGKESSAAEREAASLALEESLDARAAGDWKTQCETLAAAAVEQLEQSASSLTPGTSCAQALEAQGQSLPAFARANTMTGPIDAFRINQGINGFAFYHGTRGQDYVIPLIKQGGEWKVVVPQEEEIR